MERSGNAAFFPYWLVCEADVVLAAQCNSCFLAAAAFKPLISQRRNRPVTGGSIEPNGRQMPRARWRGTRGVLDVEVEQVSVA